MHESLLKLTQQAEKQFSKPVPFEVPNTDTVIYLRYWTGEQLAKYDQHLTKFRKLPSSEQSIEYMWNVVIALSVTDEHGVALLNPDEKDQLEVIKQWPVMVKVMINDKCEEMNALTERHKESLRKNS